MDNLKHLGIHFLRQYARDVGVKAPTTLKKNELIQEIRLIENKTKEPCLKNSNRGRKPLISVDSKKINNCKNCIYFEKYKKIDDFVLQINKLYKIFNEK